MVALTVAFLAGVPVTQASAQNGTAVVQPLPTAESQRLNDALRRVARNPNDQGALLEAGRAALGAGDVSAAEGFFTRANQLRPGDPEVKLGLAAVAARSEDPFTALRLFDEVQASGRDSAQYAADRGLAYDLVGDNARAQQFYAEAMRANRTPELVRRLALSQAIGGDIRAAEATLLPLLEQQDLAAFRTRAFVLAIAGKRDDAMAIAEAVMPPAMARRLEPYLGYMARLTPAQQAAAGNFGHFPLASQIGTDDPRIAALNGGVASARSTQVASADSTRLVPRGEPLGQTTRRATRRATARPVDELPPVASAPQPSPTPAATPTPGPAQTRSVGEIVATNLRELPPPTRGDLQRGAQERAAQGATAASAQQAQQAVAAAEQDVADRQFAAVAEALAGPSITLPPETRAPASGSSQRPAAGPPTQEVSAPPPAQTAALPAAVSPQTELPPADTSAQPVLVARMEPSASPPPPPSSGVTSTLDAIRSAQSAPAEPPATEFAGANSAGTAATSVVPRSATIERQTDTSASVAEAFVGFDLGQSATRPAAGAVDLTAIEIPREVERDEPETPPPPPPPKEPSRIWVQIATGQDKSALRFDYRRMARKAPDLFKDRKGFTASWGQTNRLVTGPFDSNADANRFVTALKEAEIDSFRFTSSEGEAVEPLP